MGKDNRLHEGQHGDISWRCQTIVQWII
jgi:hypothetical protein